MLAQLREKMLCKLPVRDICHALKCGCRVNNGRCCDRSRGYCLAVGRVGSAAPR